MLNDRFDTGNNNFTCISHRGRSVVDYMFLPRCFYNNVKCVNIFNVTDLCQSLKVTPEKAMPYYKHENANETTVSTNSEVLYEKVNNSINKRLFLKHNCDNLPEYFMNNEDILDQIQSTIYRIEQRSRTLESIDDIYEILCQIYYTEMDVKLNYFNVNCQKTC